MASVARASSSLPRWSKAVHSKKQRSAFILAPSITHYLTTILAKAKKKELETEWNTSFQLYVQAAQAFLKIVNNTSSIDGSTVDGQATRTTADNAMIARDKDERTQARAHASLALERAQKIKRAYPDRVQLVQRNIFSPEEQQAVLESSSIVNGVVCPLWKGYTPSLSVKEDDRTAVEWGLEPGDRWVSKDKVFGPNCPMLDLNMLPYELVQSVVSNCSVVASIIVCWQHHLIHGSSLILDRLFPQAEGDSLRRPIESSNGRYAYKMFLNGVERKVIIDDRMPLRGDLVMSVRSTRRSCLWPSLVEKAYLKINGGYGFKGSDSGVDLRALIGWIPDSYDLQSTAFEREKTWSRISTAFRQGNVLVTFGTAKEIPSHASRPLIPFHAYACIGLEDNEDRMVTIVNPWRSIDANDAHRSEEAFWRIPWDDLSAQACPPSASEMNCPSACLHHLRKWKIARSPGDGILNQQIRIAIDAVTPKTDIWALLSRHTYAQAETELYSALHAFEEDGAEITFNKAENLTFTGHYLNSPHCLLKMTCSDDTKRISLIASLSFPNEADIRDDVPYTLSIMSHAPLEFDTRPPPNMVKQIISYEFNSLYSGGNLLYPTYFDNPQWTLKVPAGPSSSSGKQSAVRLQFHATASKDIPLNIKVYRSAEKRVNDVTEGTVVFDSGTYSYGIACGQVSLLPGNYVVVLSNYVATQHGKGTLEISSERSVELQRAPAEGAGMHTSSLHGNWMPETAAGGPSHGRYWRNPQYEMFLSRSAEVCARLQVTQTRAGALYLPINLSLFQYQETSPPTEVATSGPYRESRYGVRLSRRRLAAGRYLLVPSTHSPGIQGLFEVSVWSDSPISVQYLETTQ
ncbi:hypothetical protein PIIN_05280 [Serendipita indica DSM 11827]|uniref:Calpain catalytic domain-containing protein n=1 Tax=Serendipita indica (strain DSM 11827) TaxID=1109443 RepID=G4TJ48_SERID|nr:hypothetical protein PIIN_05280 [Serendipita indica DSM 11827]